MRLLDALLALTAVVSIYATLAMVCLTPNSDRKEKSDAR